MPISYAKQDGKRVEVWENNTKRLDINGTLIGYTNTTVTVKDGSQTRLYEENKNGFFDNRTI
jgi:hypothetical protein